MQPAAVGQVHARYGGFQRAAFLVSLDSGRNISRAQSHLIISHGSQFGGNLLSLCDLGLAYLIDPRDGKRADGGRRVKRSSLRTWRAKSQSM